MDYVVNSNESCLSWIKQKKEKYNYTDEKIKQQFKKQFDNGTQLIFPEYVKRINTICDETNCNIVWSSSWRLLDKYKDIENAKKMFNRRGLYGNRLIGYTPQLHFRDGGYRGSAISYWLKERKDIEISVVLDDRPDAGIGLPFNCYYIGIVEGIQDYDVNYAIDILNKKSKEF